MTNPYINPNSTGGTLQGIASLLRGLGQLRDPDKQKRDQLATLLQTNPDLKDQYIEQYSDNPQALNQLLGKKPLFGNSNYDELKATLTGPLTPEAQAKIDVAKSTSARSRLDLAETNRLSGIQSIAMDIENRRNNAPNSVIPLPPVTGPVAETNESLNYEPFGGKKLSPEAYNQYKEYQAKVTGTLTPEQRAENKARIEEQQARAAKETASVPLEQIRTKAGISKLEDQDADRIVAQKALARVGNTNLYEASLNGRLSATEKNAIINNEKSATQYKDDQDAYFKNQQLDIERSHLRATQTDIANKKNESAALWLFEKAQTNGGQIGMDDARRIVANPQVIKNSTDPKDAPLKEALDGIQNATLKDTRNKVSQTYAKWLGSLKGKKPTDEDITNLNNEVATLTPGTGFEPIVYQKQITEKNYIRADKSQVVPISGDPRILPAGHKLVSPQQDPSLDTFEQAVSKVKGLPKDQMVKKLTEMGWDPNTGQKVKK